MTTTSDARKRLAEKNERPTPAPVAVPEGGWQHEVMRLSELCAHILVETEESEESEHANAAGRIETINWLAHRACHPGEHPDIAQARPEPGADLTGEVMFDHDAAMPTSQPVADPVVADPQDHPHLSNEAAQAVDQINEPARCGSTLPHAPHLVSDESLGYIGNIFRCSGKEVPASVRESVVADPLPSEAVREHLDRRLRDMGATRERSGFGGEESTWINAPIEVVLDEVDRLVAEDDEDTPAESGHLRIENGWLVREVDHHTCGTGSEGYYGAHEPGCGLIPEVHLSTLPGWPIPEDDEDTVRERIAQAIEAEPRTRENTWHDGFAAGLNTAARIARAGS